MEKKLLNIDELSVYIGVKKSTIYQWVREERIPVVRLGRLRFQKDRIDLWIKERSIEPRNF